MKTYRLSLVITVLLTLVLSSVVYAGPGSSEAGPEPETINSFSFTPTVVNYGGTITASINFLANSAGVGGDNVFCFYFISGNWFPATWPATVVSGNGDTYSLTYMGVSGGGDCFAWGGQGVAEYVIAQPPGVGFPAAFVGDSLSVAITLPSGPPPPQGTNVFTLFQMEGIANCAVAHGGPGCAITSNIQASVEVAPAVAYVSNDPTCGGNSPCLSGGTALADALAGVASGGTVSIVGTYSQGGASTATLSGPRHATLDGFNSPRIENGTGTCSGPMIENSGFGTLTIDGITIDGTCTTGSRTVGVLNSGTGTTNLMDSSSTIRDFTTGAGVSVSSGVMNVWGNRFDSNNVAMSQTGATSTLFAFANNVVNNIGTFGATTAGGGNNNMRCNYWAASTLSGFAAANYAERLGSEVVNYVEGSAPSVGQASVAAVAGTQVVIDMGRNTVNPPFNNGTVTGLGALVSDFYAACGTRGTTTPGAISIVGDGVLPGPTGFRLYSVTDPTQCSPASNTACWDFQEVSAGDSASCTTLGCSVTDPSVNAGNFVIGNEVDPTAVAFKSLTVTSSSNIWLPVALVMASLLVTGTALVVSRRKQQ